MKRKKRNLRSIEDVKIKKKENVEPYFIRKKYYTEAKCPNPCRNTNVEDVRKVDMLSSKFCEKCSIETSTPVKGASLTNNVKEDGPKMVLIRKREKRTIEVQFSEANDTTNHLKNPKKEKENPKKY